MIIKSAKVLASVKQVLIIPFQTKVSLQLIMSWFVYKRHLAWNWC